MCSKLGKVGKVKSKEETLFLPSLPFIFGAVGSPAFSSRSALQVRPCSGSFPVLCCFAGKGAGQEGTHQVGAQFSWRNWPGPRSRDLSLWRVRLSVDSAGSSQLPGLFPWALKSVPMLRSRLLLEFMVGVWVGSPALFPPGHDRQAPSLSGRQMTEGAE